MNKDINGTDVKILSHGVGALHFVCVASSLGFIDISMKSFSSGEILLYSDGELDPKKNHKIDHRVPTAPEK